MSGGVYFGDLTHAVKQKIRAEVKGLSDNDLYAMHEQIGAPLTFEEMKEKGLAGEMNGIPWVDVRGMETSDANKVIDEMQKTVVQEGKPSNPKDLIGTNKVPLSLVPAMSIAYQSLGHLEGHLKYGKTNWREAGVKFTIYIDAMLRHIEKLCDGEWADPETHVPHLGNILACAGIIVDAYESGKLIDDRPKQAPTGAGIDRLGAVVKHLREMHKDKSPVHYYHEGKIDE